ncbi:MAG: bifunctional UDP-N-acetylglucosamine diphosphorylase/glucosamine-1-phosphate N-acetyltransferase GlmU [Chloroflexi bacterium]|nr:bifunctional UDP-N-acetylglucosamine diphosphorylase/glucosamine-1-phosphate N-acetyltransferase GlmU [Chloroflexota bacterium]
MFPDPTSTAAIILAAGLGTRMKSRVPKLLHPVCGRPMLGYVIDAARQALGTRPLVVYSPLTEKVREVFAEEADFALQDPPQGTGDAVRAALPAVDLTARDVLVLNGDIPLLTATSLTTLVETHASSGAVMTISTMRPADPSRYGRVVRDAAGVRGIVEESDALGHELAIGEVNAGLYAFQAGWLRDRIGDLRPSASGELYITDLVALAVAEGRAVAAVELPAAEVEGLDHRVKLAWAETQLRQGINRRLMLGGVSMQDPATAYIDATVTLAEDVTLEPDVILRGATSVGRGTLIRSGSQVFDSAIGEDCVIWASVLESCEVEDQVQVGPFAHLRPGSSIGRGAKLGNYAEVKNSRVGPGTQQHHFSYLGDATVGERVNIGAGTITANYDGKTKHRTVIGDGAFIGSDTMLVAPVEIGAGAATGAGSVVTRNVPAGKVAVGVPARIRERRGQQTPDEDPA